MAVFPRRAMWRAGFHTRQEPYRDPWRAGATGLLVRMAGAYLIRGTQNDALRLSRRARAR